MKPFFFWVTMSTAWVAGPLAAQTTGMSAPANGISAPARAVSPMPATLTLPEVLEAARQNLDVRMAQQDVAATRADILAANHVPLPVLSAKAASADQVGFASIAAAEKAGFGKDVYSTDCRY
jgi:outer membrane protein TolC